MSRTFFFIGILYEDIYNALAYENKFISVSMKGAVLSKILQMSLQNYGKGAFLLTSGLSIVYNEDNNKRKLVSATVLSESEKIVPGKSYKVLLCILISFFFVKFQ